MGQARLLSSAIIVIFLFVQHSVYAGVCKEGCPSNAAAKSPKFNFEAGQVYTYSLDSVITIFISGSKQQQTQVKLNGEVQVFASGNCQYTLKVAKLTIESPDGKPMPNIGDLAKPIKFVLSQDGELTPEICAESTDTPFSLNVKRGIISLLQSTEGKSYETDVFGVCPTSTSSAGTGSDNVVVTKTRDLNNCAHRELLSDGFIKGIFNEASGVKTTPFLNGEFQLEQKIEGGVLKSAQLNEQYKYIPFSTQNTGTRAKVFTKLTYVKNEAKPAPAPQKPKERGLLFENTYQGKGAYQSYDTVKQAIEKTAAAVSPAVQKTSAAQFAELVRLLRQQKKADLQKLYGSSKSDPKTRKVFLDALFRAGSSDSVAAIAELLKKELNEQEQRLAFLSFNLASAISRDTLTAVAKVIGPNSPREAFLGVGTLINKYCKSNGCAPSDITEIYKKFSNNLGSCKPTGRPQEDKLVAILKAIRNADILVEPVLKNVIECTTNKASSRVRVAALQAFGSSCNKKLQTLALNLLKDRLEDSEIRIEAYLSLVKCPSSSIANEIKTLLDDEPVYQVGSYINSHIANLRASADPHREDLKRHFGNVRPSYKFPNDIRKYSFNREFSYAIDSLGLGASVDMDVIYSQKGFLPRSGRFNLTGEVFGSVFNVFELNMRQENLEQVLEHYFGPKGELHSTSVQDLVNNAITTYNSVVENTKSRFERRRRGVSRDEINNFKNSVQLSNDVFSDVEIDLSAKLFGTELYFLSLSNEIPNSPKEFVEKLFRVVDKGIKGAKDFNQVYEHNVLFVDVDLVYPVGVGVPLKLGVKGAAASRLEASAKIDLKTFRKNPSFLIKLLPSYNIEVTGTFLIDAQVVQTGIKLVADVHSSTGSEVDFSLTEDKKKFNMKVNFPETNQEVFSFDTNTFIVVTEEGKNSVEIAITPESTKNRKDFSGCFDQFHGIVGLTVCPSYEINLGGGDATSLTFPFAGPNSVKLKLEVERAFQLEGSYSQIKPKHSVVKYIFTTPASENKRQMSLEFEMAYDSDYFVKVALDSPFKKASAEAGLKKNSKEFALYAAATNDKDEYLAKFGFDVSGNEIRSKYKPTIIIKDPKSSANSVGGYVVDGEVVVEKANDGSKYIFDNLKVTTPQGAPYVVNGYITRQGKRIEYDLRTELNTDKKKAQIKGAFDQECEKEFGKFLFDLALTSDFHEALNGQLKFDNEWKKGSLLKNEILVIYGKDLASTNNRFQLFQNAKYSKGEGEKLATLDSQIKILAPFVPFTFNLVNHYKASKEAQFDLSLEGGATKLNINSNNKYYTKSKGDFDVSLEGSLNAHNGKIVASRVVGSKLSDVSAKVTSSCGFGFDLNGKVSNQLTTEQANIDLTAVTTLPQKKDTPYTLKFVLDSSKSEFKSNANLLEGSTEIATYTASGKRGDTTEGKFDVQVKDILSGNGELQSVKGKGTLSALISLNRIDRKLKIESDFNVAKPTYDVNTKFFYDFEKDNNKKIEFTTASNIDFQNLDSKNSLQILTEKYTFNVAGKASGSTLVGEFNGNFELGLPTGRKLTGSLDRSRQTNDNKATGKVKLELSDVHPGGKKRTLTVDTNVKNADFKATLFDVAHKLTYVDLDNKDIVLTANIVRSPSDASKKTSIGVNVQGSLLPTPIAANFASDEFSDAKAEYKLNGKYGQVFDFDLGTKYNIEQNSENPSTNEFKFLLNVPETKLKVVKVDWSSSLKEPKGDDGLYEMKHSANIQFSDKVVTLDESLKGNLNRGDIKVALSLPDFAPINLKGSFNYNDKTQDTHKSNVDLEVTYGQGKRMHLKTDGSVSPTDVSIQATIQTPVEKAQNIAVNFNWKVTGGNTYTTNVKLDVDQRAYAYNGVAVLSESAPSVLIEFTYPEKTVRFNMAAQKLEDFKYTGLVKIENFLDYNLDLNGEVLFKNVDNFYLKINLDSTNFKQVAIELNSKAGGKGIEFKGSKEGKNVLSGTADFNIKDEKGKTVIEGQGSVKLYEEQQSTNFKFIRSKFNAAKDGEEGMSFVLDGRVGSRNVFGELKLTDKNVLFKNTICEEKKQCINIDFRSSLQKIDLNDFHHELVISVDLRQLGYSHEFGLKADTTKKDLVVDHTVDMHLQSLDKNKYQYSLYVHQNSAGVVLTLPSRTIALESQYNYPTDNLFGKYDAGVAFYLDKINNPTGKTSLNFNGNLERPATNSVKGAAEIRLDHPSIKALVVSGKTELDADNQKGNTRVELDIFQQKQKKLVVLAAFDNSDKTGKGFNVTSDLKLRSKGLGLDVGFDGHAALNYDTRVISVGANAVCPTKEFTFGSFLFIGEKAFELYTRVFDEPILKVLANYDLSKRSATYNSYFKQLGNSPLEINSVVDGLTTASFTVTKENLLNVKGSYELGKEANLNVQGSGKELFNAKVSLDQANFLTSNFKADEAETKTFLTTLKDTIKSENENTRKIYADKFEKLKEAVQTQFKNLQGSTPDFSKLKDEYQKQWEKLQTELQSDPTFKKIADFVIQIFNSVSKVIDELSKVFLEYYEKISATLKEFFDQITQAVNEKFLPALKEFYKQIEQVFYSVYEETISLLAGVFERVAKALKGFEDDFNKISAAISELFKNMSSFSKEYFQQFEKELKDLYKLLLEQLQALPGVDLLKEKIKEFFDHNTIRIQAAEILKELLSAIEPHLPTPEFQKFLSSLSSYINKKLLKEQVNDTQVLKELFESWIKAVRSLVKILGDIRKDREVSGWINSLPISFEGFKRISYIWSFKFSPFNCIREGNCFSIRDLLNYRPYGFEITELVPPFSLHAQIGDGQHIFTFDGKHITFPGSCSYVLAQDALNGNFSLVANLEDGKLKSVTLFDQTDAIELDKSGIVTYNGAPSELPLHKGDVHAWRRYYSVSLLTTYGVHVFCSSDLRICHVTVSGFYHNRLRGLLGNGNNEPYDDFLQPDGQIASDSAVFGNSYGIGSCAPVASVEHTHTSDSTCSELFGTGSGLRTCYFFVSNRNYREACEHAVATAADKEDAACNIALLYASACKLEKIPVLLPSRCAKCQVNEKKIAVGESFPIELPQKQADGVIVIDTGIGESVTKLVDGVVTELRKELKNRGFDDIRLGVIGYNMNEKYVSIYTSNGQLDFTGKFPGAANGPEKVKPIKTGDEKIDKYVEKVFAVIDRISEDLIQTPDAKAYREAVDFPFRPTANKFILATRSTDLKYSSPIKVLLAGVSSGITHIQGIQVHSLLPVAELTADSGDVKKIVGFNKENVLVLADGRKRPEGSPDLRSKLAYKEDLGIEATVSNGGWVFNLQNYLDGDAKQQKQYALTLAAAVADQLKRTEQKLECICLIKYSLVPSEVCRVANENVLPPVKKVASRG